MFRNAITVFRVYGIDIRLDPSWFIVAGLFAWSLSVQYFPGILPGQSQLMYISLGVTAMLLFFASLLLHELAHSVVAIGFGLKIENITLFIFGGVAGLKQEPESAREEFLIAIAGPLMSFLLGGAGLLIGGLLGGLGSIPAAALFAYLGTINLVLAIFNLVPAFPMDGGRVLRAAIWYFKKDRVLATTVAARGGTMMGYGFMALGALSFFNGGGVSGIWLVFIGFFVVGTSRAAYQQQVIEAGLKGHRVAEVMTPAPVVVDPAIPLSELVQDVMLAHNVGFVPVVRDGALLGYIDRHILHGVDKDKWPVTMVADVYEHRTRDNTVSPDYPTEKLVQQMTGNGANKFLVAEGDRLVGVVSINDILGFIQLSQELV